ncbi:MAG TPA: SdrD B-like domain-containing protein [Saprospiraceae bacterium]|nr:SdrD B-like domain-containing protein [Saprospiraceae bacterium]
MKYIILLMLILEIKSIRTNDVGSKVNYSEQSTYSLSGYVYKDLNSNGIKDQAENGLANIQVKLLNAVNGQPTNYIATTNAQGFYSINSIEPYTYRANVSVINFRPTVPIDGLIDFPLHSNKTLDFGFTNLLYGIAYHDKNRNGVKDHRDVTLNGIEVKLIKNNIEIASTVTNQLGVYNLNIPPIGSYTLKAITPVNFIGQNPHYGQKIIQITNGSLSTNDFGFKKMPNSCNTKTILDLSTGIANDGNQIPIGNLDPYWKLTTIPNLIHPVTGASVNTPRGIARPNMYRIAPPSHVSDWNQTGATSISPAKTHLFSYNNTAHIYPWVIQRSFCVTKEGDFVLEGQLKSDDIGQIFFNLHHLENFEYNYFDLGIGINTASYTTPLNVNKTFHLLPGTYKLTVFMMNNNGTIDGSMGFSFKGSVSSLQSNSLLNPKDGSSGCCLNDTHLIGIPKPFPKHDDLPKTPK